MSLTFAEAGWLGHGWPGALRAVDVVNTLAPWLTARRALNGGILDRRSRRIDLARNLQWSCSGTAMVVPRALGGSIYFCTLTLVWFGLIKYFKVI